MEPEHAERRFRKKVVKRLGVAVTDFVTEKLKTKMDRKPAGAGFQKFSVPTVARQSLFFSDCLSVPEAPVRLL